MGREPTVNSQEIKYPDREGFMSKPEDAKTTLTNPI